MLIVKNEDGAYDDAYSIKDYKLLKEDNQTSHEQVTAFSKLGAYSRTQELAK